MPTAIIGEIKKALKVSVVDTLPDQGRPNRLYFVLNGDDDDNRYNEYIWIKDDLNPNGVWELVGYKYVDLTPYYTKEEVDNLLKNKLDNSTFEEFEELYNQTIQELLNKDKELEKSIQGVKDTYLPLSGGTMTGDIVFPSGPDANGYEYVDLGLPSGNLWAKYNIGANSEEEAGLYFQWGDTQGYTAEQVGDGEGLKAFSWADYKFSIDGSGSNFSKYNKTDNKTVLDPEDDAAHVNMGGNWRMPTFEECKELCLNTDIYLVPTEGEEIQGTAQEQSGSIMINWASQAEGTSKGVKFYKKGDKQTYMFVPVSGGAGEGSMRGVGQNGILWSSSLYSSDVQDVWGFGFNADSGYVIYDTRYLGFPVRGILPGTTSTKSAGIKVQGKTSSDLVNAAGGTTSIDDIINPVTNDLTLLIVRLHALLTVYVDDSISPYNDLLKFKPNSDFPQTDVNTLTTLGLYAVAGGTDYNAPSDSLGFVLVSSNGDPNYFTLTYVDSNGRFWSRGHNTSGYSEWAYGGTFLNNTAPINDSDGVVTLTLEPGRFYVFSGESKLLTLTLLDDIVGLTSEYQFQFTSGASPTALILPDTIKWIGDHEIYPNTTYLVSILNNIAVMGGC